MKRNKLIQELRGVSIIFICIYHCLKYNKTDGYLSVSIFLQISGYIITSHYKSNNLNVLQFYYKRIVGIFPKLFFVITVLLIISQNITYNNLINLYSEIKSVIRISSNYYFYKKDIDYFSQFDNPSYTLHFWYISLIEQIYILYPILQFIYLNYYNIFNIILIISFIIFSWYLFANPSFSYYIVICRLFEYMLGMNANSKVNKSIVTISSQNIAVYVLIVVQIVKINCNRIYKFIIINLSSLYTILLINNSLLEDNFLLHNRILYEIGNISYELYLIHYPLFQCRRLSNISYILYLAIFSKLLSFLNFISKRMAFILSIFLPLIIDTIIERNKAIYFMQYKDKIIAPKINPNKEYGIVFKYINSYLQINYKYSNIFLLLGDSHLQQWFPAIIRIAKSVDYGIAHYYFHINIIEINNLLKIYMFIKRFMKFRITYILSFYIYNDIIQKYNSFSKYFEIFVENLQKYSLRIYIIEDIPFLNINPLDCIYSNIKYKKCYAVLGINASINKIPYINNKNIIYCNMNVYICINKVILLLKEGYIVYKDYHHLTLSFSNTLTQYLSKCIIK